MFDCAQDVGGSGAARRRRDRLTSLHWRHEQLSLRMLRASMGHHSWQTRTSLGVQTDDDVLAATRAATRDVTYDALAPLIEYVPDDTYAAPAPVMKHVSSAPDDTYIAPASTRVICDIRCLVNPQFSIFAVETSFPAVDDSAPPVYKQVVQQIDRFVIITCRCWQLIPSINSHVQFLPNLRFFYLFGTKNKTGRVPLGHHRCQGKGSGASGPLLLEQRKVQEIPEVQVAERIQEQIVPERIEEQIGDIPVHPIVQETVGVQILERIREQIGPEQIEEQLIAEETTQNPVEIPFTSATTVVSMSSRTCLTHALRCSLLRRLR